MSERTRGNNAEDAHLRVGFIGLGAMGNGMARSLLRRGFIVSGYDVNPAAVHTLVTAGGTGATSIVEVATDADALVVLVLNSEQAESVLFGPEGAVAALSPGAVVVLCSTVAPSFVRSVATRLAARDLHFVDAPVSGGVARAAEGRLSIMVAAQPDALVQAQPILAAMAENLFHMGSEPGQGATMKLVNQVLAGIHLAAAAEALALGAKAGIDPQRIYEVICASAGASWMFENRVPHILADDFTPHSAVEIWLKDLGLVLDTGKEVRIPLPLAAAAQQLFVMAAASGYGRFDDAAVVKVYEKLADFSVLDATSSQNQE